MRDGSPGKTCERKRIIGRSADPIGPAFVIITEAQTDVMEAQTDVKD